MLCRNCGVRLDGDVKFCEKCGSAVIINDYPTIELVSSGPMKYRKTNLDIARLDLDSVRIDLNEKYSSYVIPVAQAYSPMNMTQNSTVSAPDTNKQKKIPAGLPRYNVNADGGFAREAENIPYIRQNVQNMPRYNELNPNMQYAPPRNPAPAPYVNTQRESDNNTKSDNVRSGALEFILSLVAMMFMGVPVASLVLSIVVLKNASKLEKSAKLKNAAIGMALFVLVTSCLSVFAHFSG